MGFVKDGETKVYKDKIIKGNNDKTASQKESVRYTVDDLVRDTEGLDQETESGEDDVSH